MSEVITNRFDIEPLQVYFKNGGTTCLFCMSEDIQSKPPRAEGENIYVDVSCNDCKQSWTETYTLSGVHPKGE